MFLLSGRRIEIGGINTSLTKDFTRSVKAAARLSSVLVAFTASSGDFIHQTNGDLEDIILKRKVDEAFPEALNSLVASAKQGL